jgi:cytosine/adenosine deaminase-related metal-dependent hydrolase
MDALLTDAVVVTQDEQRRILDRAAVAVRGDRIAAVGDAATLEAANPDLPRVSLRGRAILPGFINSHTHTILTVIRPTVEDWDGNAVYGYLSPISYAMHPEERQVMAMLGVLEGVRSGCTMFVDPQPETVFDRVNRNGAAAIGRSHDLGSIEPGKKADLTIVNLNTPVMRPVINLVGNLVHYGHPGIVESVMVDGAWVLHEGRVTTVDEAAILAEAQKVTRRVWQRMLDANPDLPPPRALRWLDV